MPFTIHLNPDVILPIQTSVHVFCVCYCFILCLHSFFFSFGQNLRGLELKHNISQYMLTNKFCFLYLNLFSMLNSCTQYRPEGSDLIWGNRPFCSSVGGQRKGPSWANAAPTSPWYQKIPLPSQCNCRKPT
jgi:hypothetical protein